MATCGPSNPLASLGKQIARDNSLQTEGVYDNRGPASTGRFRNQRVTGNDASFNQALNEPSIRDFTQVPDALPTYMPPQSHQPQVGPSQHPAQFNNSLEQRLNVAHRAGHDWSAEFAGLSLQARPSQLRQFTPTQDIEKWQQFSDRSHYNGMAQRPMPLMAAVPTVAQESQEALDRRKAEDEAFSRAFAAVDHQTQKFNETPAAPAVESEDLSHAARAVLDTVSSASTDDAFTSKVKTSKFMALLGQLSAKETVTDGEGNFVDASGVRVDPYAELNKPHIPESEHTGEPSYSEVAHAPVEVDSSSRHHNPSGYQASGLNRPLEDPIAYLERTNQSHRLLSSFEEANKLGPMQVDIADWEEHYEEAVWTTSS